MTAKKMDAEYQQKMDKMKSEMEDHIGEIKKN